MTRLFVPAILLSATLLFMLQPLAGRVLWGNPELNPTSTNFGKITTATNSIMRFFTFVSKVTF